MSVTDKGIDYLNGHKIGLGTALALLAIAYFAGRYGLNLAHSTFMDHAEAEEAHEPFLIEKKYRIEKLDGDIGEKQVARSVAKIQAIREPDPQAKQEIMAYDALLECQIQQDRKVRGCVESDGEACYSLRQDCSP